MSMDPVQPSAGEAHVILDAAANVHAASVCAVALHDRIALLYATRRARPLTTAATSRQIADVNRAAVQLEAAIARMFDGLDPTMPRQIEAMADLARERTIASLGTAPPAPATAHGASTPASRAG